MNIQITTIPQPKGLLLLNKLIFSYSPMTRRENKKVHRLLSKPTKTENLNENLKFMVDRVFFVSNNIPA